MTSRRRTSRLCKVNWDKFSHETEDLLGYSMQMQDTATETVSPTLTDKKLAYAYIYGDTVHAVIKTAWQRLKISVSSIVLKAAVPIVAGLMATAIMTLNLMRTLQRLRG